MRQRTALPPRRRWRVRREITGTALLAAATFRLAVLAPELFDEKFLEWAEGKRQAVADRVSEGGVGWPAAERDFSHPHVTLFPKQGTAEGQIALMLLHAAYRDYVCEDVCKPPKTKPMKDV